MPRPEVMAYARESVIAEKLEAMVMLGDRNSRIKDFFDLWYLARSFSFDRAVLAKAITSIDLQATVLVVGKVSSST